MSSELVVLLNGAPAGAVQQLADGDLRFSYAEEWRNSDVSYPLSLSMPLVQPVHGDKAVRPYMEGLLPDNETVLQAWGRDFGVSARNPFALLTHVGEDVAGAVQFVRADRFEAMAVGDGSIEWLSEPQIGDRLGRLVRDRTAWRLTGDEGYFSLAGAQPKTALLWDGKRWGLPSGSVPTTHILKPPAMELEGLAENEHLCLRVAGSLGLPAVNSEVREFAGQIAIVVERYDRYREDGRIVRIHQEDFCQALAISPRSKYESEGGPGVAALIRVLRENSSDPEADINSLVASLGLHWGLGAPDAHGKNYSILIAPGGQVRLAPLYDVISVLPYP
ncbi:MAG: type II toxin-antitoxin system HipA family toxin, partial [Rhodothermales bacterium]